VTGSAFAPTVALLLATGIGACTAAPDASPTAPPPSPTLAPATASPTSSPTAGQTPTQATDAPTLPPVTLEPTSSPLPTTPPAAAYEFEEYDVPAGSRPHDVAPAPDGTVWYTGQGNGTLGRLDPTTGEVSEIPLGRGSAPHGVIVAPDGAAWVTDGGRNEIQRVDPTSGEITRYPLPDGSGNANLNTAAFDGSGVHWFTGQNGIYGRVDPSTGEVEVFQAPRGRGPYGIATTPGGEVWYVSLAGSYLARLDSTTGAATVIEPPTSGQGARRVWSDSLGRLWISEWNAGQLGMYDPAADEWREWRLPGSDPQPYSIYVDELDLVWLTDFGSNSLVRFDAATETFESFEIPTARAAIRQQLGREGELWGAESATDKLVVLRRTVDE
jgi:virginiamycin B lyase